MQNYFRKMSLKESMIFRHKSSTAEGSRADRRIKSGNALILINNYYKKT